ncbi:MAG: DUF6326 family protein [Terracidiphilus sp.]|nr:DUF6326 family protein [Terracidiphilus sp.]
MNPDKQTPGMDTEAKLSTLWIFVLFNMVYADILSLMDPASPIRSVMQGASLPPGGLLAGAILMETPIAMVLLSRVLQRKANRWANIIVAAINMVAVIAGEQARPYYVFFATIEVICMSVIVWLAWKWADPEAYG